MPNHASMVCQENGFGSMIWSVVTRGRSRKSLEYEWPLFRCKSQFGLAERLFMLRLCSLLGCSSLMMQAVQASKSMYFSYSWGTSLDRASTKRPVCCHRDSIVMSIDSIIPFWPRSPFNRLSSVTASLARSDPIEKHYVLRRTFYRDY